MLSDRLGRHKPRDLDEGSGGRDTCAVFRLQLGTRGGSDESQRQDDSEDRRLTLQSTTACDHRCAQPMHLALFHIKLLLFFFLETGRKGSILFQLLPQCVAFLSLLK